MATDPAPRLGALPYRDRPADPDRHLLAGRHSLRHHRYRRNTDHPGRRPPNRPRAPQRPPPDPDQRRLHRQSQRRKGRADREQKESLGAPASRPAANTSTPPQPLDIA
jgi:hypothetical protein